MKKIRTTYFIVTVLLLALGLRINQVYQNQRLLLAVHKGSFRTARSALQWGADVNHPDSPIAILGQQYLRDAKSRSHAAGRNHLQGFTEFMELLLDAGADINLPDGRGYTLLDYMVQTGFPKVVEGVVLKGADVNSPRNGAGKDPHPLMLAARARGPSPDHSKYQYTKLIDYLVDQGADAKVVDEFGLGVLYFLSSQQPDHRLDNLMKKLVEKGAPVTPKLKYHHSPLVQAVKGGRIRNVRVLLELGADVDYWEQGRRTAAFFAAYGSAGEEAQIEILKILIEAGANLDLELEGRPSIREAQLTQIALKSLQDASKEDTQDM